MTTFAVISKADGTERYRYVNDNPVEFAGFEFLDFDHVPQPDEPPPAPRHVGRVMTKLTYLRLFTQAERIAIRAAAAASAELADYLELLATAEEVNTADPDILQALQMLESVGLVGPGRAAEILEG